MKDEQVSSTVSDAGEVSRPSGENATKQPPGAARTVVTPDEHDELADPIKLAQRMSEFLSRRY